MVHSSISPVPNTEVRGFLRFFYLTWNILGTVILGLVIFSPKSHITDLTIKIIILIASSLLCTWFSFLLGVRAKMWLMGMIDSSLIIKSKITFKVFLLALFAQTVPLWGKSFYSNDWRTFVLGGTLSLLFWFSAKSIKIDIPDATKEN
jgi:hypothetical protein